MQNRTLLAVVTFVAASALVPMGLTEAGATHTESRNYNNIPFLSTVTFDVHPGDHMVSLRILDAHGLRTMARVTIGQSEDTVCQEDTLEIPAGASEIRVAIGDSASDVCTPGVGSIGTVVATFADDHAPSRYVVRYEGTMMNNYCVTPTSNGLLDGCVPVAGRGTAFVTVRDDVFLIAAQVAFAFYGASGETGWGHVCGSAQLSVPEGSTHPYFLNLPLGNLHNGEPDLGCPGMPPAAAGSILALIG